MYRFITHDLIFLQYLSLMYITLPVSSGMGEPLMMRLGLVRDVRACFQTESAGSLHNIEEGLVACRLLALLSPWLAHTTEVRGTKLSSV